MAIKAINILKTELSKRGEAGDLFGWERDHQLQGILGNISQTFDGKELYPSAEEKAASLLYFVIKDHPFSDGNKRIGSFLFLVFLEENGLLEKSGINDNGLVALALLIAESDPRQKDLLVRLVLNLLKWPEITTSNLPTTGQSELEKTYYKYWGKTDNNSYNYHLLPYHCLDVAAVGQVLLDPEKPLCRRLGEQIGLSPELLQQWFIFFLCLHDIGKFATAFQGLVPGLSPQLVPASQQKPYTERHDSLGYLLWDDEEGLLDRLQKTSSFLGGDLCSNPIQLRRTLDVWIQIVTGHHGIPPKTSPINRSNHFTKQDEEAALQFVQSVCSLLLSERESSFLADKTFCYRLKQASWTFAGIVVLADWLGSSRSPDSYCQHEISLDEYWRNQAIPFAEQAVAQARLDPSPVAHYAGTKHLFPFINNLTPLQQWAAERELSNTKQLFILEDVTGAGKTEAALTLAHRLMASGLADGLYVALPTMATANAMYERLSKAYRRLYAHDALPSLVLAHGSRHLSDAFRNSLDLPENMNSRHMYVRDEETAEAFCSAWLSDSRKKALLAEIGVGTLDQALLAVLPAKHQSLRCLGLARKILIVDEVHSFDPYMNHLLQRLLEYHASQGGSAILLSATLPYGMRTDYLQAFANGTGQNAPELQQKQSYPLATHFPTSGQVETVLDTRREVKRTTSVVLLDSVKQAMRVIKAAVEKGKCVCWVRNTVGDAIKTYRQLAKQDWMDKSRLSIFHSRFAMIDRQRIESATLEYFGDKSTADMRRGRVLIATQVVEQSLDLDFDVMITDLAPIDLLIQRVGREHRHVRDTSGNRIYEEGVIDQRELPVFYIVGPPATEKPAENWLKAALPGTQAVYQHVGQLWLTQQLLSKAGSLNMPGDARTLIEGVYGEAAQDAIPPALRELTWQAIGEDSGKLSMANLNVLKLAKGYYRASSDGGGWDDESRIPTRLGDETVRIALVANSSQGWRPYADIEKFAWDMSMLSVPTWRWKKAKELIPLEVTKSLETLKEEHKVLKWVELFPLTPDLTAWYDALMGWGLYKEDDDESD
ncbi:MAG: CRISPR-associated helicase Cas3' [Proteobacteria bacterium]|nr:CRISPR-associated helicase Cas3' [Pseudomonadota bacterium]